MVTEKGAKKALDELLYSVQMDAYFRGYRTGYKAGRGNLKNKVDPKRSVLTEEEKAEAIKMGKMGFRVERIRYRVHHIRENEMEWDIRSIIEGGEEGKTRLGGKTK